MAHDSAGVRVVESARPAWTPSERWSVSTTPTLEIGRAEGDPSYLLDQVRGALRLPDGRIAVANGGTSEIRFFDSTGTYLASSGRKGEGPGEYQVLQWIWKAPGDSLVAFDGRLMRISVLDSSGVAVRTFHIAPAGERGPPSAFGSTPSDDLLVTSGSGSFHFGQVGWIRGGSTYVTRYSADGTFLNEIYQAPSTPHWGYAAGGRSSAYYAPFAIGWLVYGYGGDRVYEGGGNTPEVRVFAPDGTPIRIVRWKAPTRPVTDDVKARYRETLLSEVKPSEKEYWEGWLAQVPFPDHLPVYWTLKGDPDGNLWVERYRTDWERQPTWLVFDSAGVLLGDVDTPSDFRITEIGADYLLGVHRHSMDVEQVREYRLLKPS